MSQETTTLPPKSAVRDFFEQGLVTVIMALFLMTFIAQAVEVPTGSMQNNILIGDHLFVNKFVFGQPTKWLGPLLPTREVRRGDVIVFKFPSDPKVNYVKRVIALPGEEVAVRGTRVFVNGRELPEQRVAVRQMGPNYSVQPEVRVEPAPPGASYRVYYDDRDRGGPEEEFESRAEFAVNGPVVVPPESYFAMGDNRDNSLDSRYWGFVPRANIIGHALYVYGSFNPSDPETEGSGNPLLNFLYRTNWRRTGTAIN
jgi:signal peptidase I